MQYSYRLLPALVALTLAAPVVSADLPPPPLVLAQSYDSDLDLSRYWVSEKYDGARVWWDGSQLISRGGNVYRAPAWFIEHLPKEILDGELWIGRGKFQTLMQTIRDHQPDHRAWRQVRFMVFDAPDVSGDFNARQQRLAQIVSGSKSSVLKMVPQRRVASHAALQAQLQQITLAGGEGLMLAREDGRYLAGRHAGLVKMKLHQDAEATVVDHLPGKGKYRGLLGSLLVEDAHGLRFRIGTGFTDAERADPPAIGSVVSYRYQGHTSSGKPRFARFLRVRLAE